MPPRSPTTQNHHAPAVQLGFPYDFAKNPSNTYCCLFRSPEKCRESQYHVLSVGRFSTDLEPWSVTSK